MLEREDFCWKWALDHDDHVDMLIMAWDLLHLVSGLLLLAEQGEKNIFSQNWHNLYLTCMSMSFWNIWLHSIFSNLVWFHSICLWLLLMVIFTSNSRRLQILCWEIVNPRISQSEEFVTEFPCFHQICESPAHGLVQLLWPINKYIGKYISFPIYLYFFCRHWATTLKLSTFINRWFLMSSL